MVEQDLQAQLVEQDLLVAQVLKGKKVQQVVMVVMVDLVLQDQQDQLDLQAQA